jgi:hypothetical protein
MKKLLIGAIAIACIASGVGVSTQAPSLGAVIDHLHAYLREYALRLPATIATEHYEQRCVASPRVQIVGNGRAVLESEFGIMRMESPAGWLGVRDVQSVNGEVVPDRQERLQALFLNPSGRRIDQARRIAQENARFNVGPIRRTINDPAIVLAMLEDDPNRAPLRFSKTGDTTIDGAGAWVIKFDERRRPTLIQTTTGEDQPANGRAWVDPSSGRLMRAELTIEAPPEIFGPVTHVGFTATIVVEFADEPRLGLWVPSRMTERYASLPCSGEATYTNYRIFGVQTKILSP